MNSVKAHSKLAARTIEVVNEALKAGLIPMENQNSKDLYSIMNYVLQGEAYDNDTKIIDVAQKIMNVYGVPIRPAPGTQISSSSSPTTYGSTATGENGSTSGNKESNTTSEKKD